jgi:hypothetical protein
MVTMVKPTDTAKAILSYKGALLKHHMMVIRKGFNSRTS